MLQYADDTTVYKLCSVKETLQSVSDLNSILAEYIKFMVYNTKSHP